MDISVVKVVGRETFFWDSMNSFLRCPNLMDDVTSLISQEFTNLTTLDICGLSKVTDDGMCNLKLPKLKSLRVYCGKGISDRCMTFLCGLQLEKLHFYRAENLTNITLKIIQETQKETLRKLSISHSQITLDHEWNRKSMVKLQKFQILDEISD
eukprot:TRINITY_DN10370_c0_g2_i1.p1 TRINITY_DN10370_c0_g2~~TRINITY_DN10370_c0_g2_i1.p1  ORF type:complete len:154 (-),score=29.96 TRINITY_DN10370_c0_g2_i1:222-683(-)